MRIAVISKIDNTCVNIIEAENTKVANSVCKNVYPFDIYCIKNDELLMEIGDKYTEKE